MNFYSVKVCNSRSIICIRRKIFIFYKPFCRNTLNKLIIYVTKPTAVRSDRRCGHSDTVSIREKIIDFTVTVAFGMVGFVGYNQGRRRNFFQSPASRLHHTDLTEIHINTPCPERLFYLFAQLNPMHKKQYTVEFFGSPFCDFRNYDRFSPTAWQYDTSRFYATPESIMYLLHQFFLIIS